MSRVLFFCLLSLWWVNSSAGSSCNVLLGSCPGLLGGENKYCCTDSYGDDYCCDAPKFVETKGAAVVLPIILGVLSLVVIFVCCICCACCSCCPCYRKRERGAVYVPGPSTVVRVTQNPPATGLNYGNNSYPPQAYPAQPGMPQSPPAYTTEAYSKQSPYNPNYPNP